MTENAGIIIGSSQHIFQEGKQNLFIDLRCTDVLDSSEIEGEHLNGFAGGLGAKKYMSIIGAPIATTTRDLNDLVKKNVLKRTG